MMEEWIGWREAFKGASLTPPFHFAPSPRPHRPPNGS